MGYNESRQKQSFHERANAPNATNWYNDLTPEQQNRYECFKKADIFGKFKGTHSRKLIDLITDIGIEYSFAELHNDKIMIILGSATKIFVSELIENARLISDRRSDIGPLQAIHVLEAYNELLREQPLINTPDGKRNIRRRWLLT